MSEADAPDCVDEIAPIQGQPDMGYPAAGAGKEQEIPRRGLVAGRKGAT